MRGFESYNVLKNNIRDSRQIYDITFHLYQTEAVRLKPEIKLLENRNVTLKTSINSIEHGSKALLNRLKNSYPYKLRQLILINTITSLEVFLTDVILEIFKRDIKPFKLNEPITFQRNYLFSLNSIDNLREEIVIKDFRNLTSGGMAQIVKYYKKNFELDIKNLGVNFRDIEEIHTRRHLFVHRNGIIDNSYTNKFPEFGFKNGEQLKLSHEYLLETLNKISEFASSVSKSLLVRFPEIDRKPKYYTGTINFNPLQKNLMLEISVLKEGFDAIDYLSNFQTPYRKLSDYIVKIITYDNSCNLFLTGKHSELSSFYRKIIDSKFIKLERTFEL